MVKKGWKNYVIEMVFHSTNTLHADAMAKEEKEKSFNTNGLSATCINISSQHGFWIKYYIKVYCARCTRCKRMPCHHCSIRSNKPFHNVLQMRGITMCQNEMEILLLFFFFLSKYMIYVFHNN